MKPLLGLGGTEPAVEEPSHGAPSPVPKNPVPRAALANCASISSVSSSIVEQRVTCMGGGGGGRSGIKKDFLLCGNAGSNCTLGRPYDVCPWSDRRGTFGRGLLSLLLPSGALGLGGGGGTESGRARRSDEDNEEVADRGNEGGRGDDSVTTSLISCANHSTSESTSSSSSSIFTEGVWFRSGKDFVNRMDALCDLHVGARKRCGVDSSSEVGGVMYGRLGLEFELPSEVLDVSLLSMEGVGE